MPVKPLGRRAYTSIQHLPGSHVSVGDSMLNIGQSRILTEKCRPGDKIVVQEKLDGTNVAVAKINGEIVPIIRAGYRTEDAPHEQHRMFGEWARQRSHLFDSILNEGERLCGEWLAQAHSVLYDLQSRSPFVAFDIMQGDERCLAEEVVSRICGCAASEGQFAVVDTVHTGGAISTEDAIKLLGDRGGFLATGTPPEGVVYRCEANGRVEFLGKFVRPEHTPGRWLDGEPVWNWRLDRGIEGRWARNQHAVLERTAN